MAADIDPLPDIPPPPEARTAPYRGLEFALSLKWLVLGALLYALLLLVAMAGNPEDATLPILGPSLYLTPVFGLPLVLATLNRPGRTRRILFFLVLLLPVHVAANYLAWSYAVANFDPADSAGELQRNMIAGGLGGLAGAVLSFTCLRLVRLTPLRADLPLMMFGVVLLAATGAAGMALGLYWTGVLPPGSGQTGRVILWYEIVHLPWQLAFALLLAALMRKRPPPRNPQATADPAVG